VYPELPQGAINLFAEQADLRANWQQPGAKRASCFRRAQNGSAYANRPQSWYRTMCYKSSRKSPPNRLPSPPKSQGELLQGDGYSRLLVIIGRKRSLTELGDFSVMETCKHDIRANPGTIFA
jgi:hypothetical protein